MRDTLCLLPPPPAVTANKLAGRLLLATGILFDRVFMGSIIRSPVPSPTVDFAAMKLAAMFRSDTPRQFSRRAYRPPHLTSVDPEVESHL
jgi:hypothetical protein